MHQKCSNYALTNLLFDLCRSMWIINPLVIRPSPHPRASTCPSTPKVLRTRECIATPFSSIVFTFGFTFESYDEFGGVSLLLFFKCMNFNHLVLFFLKIISNLNIWKLVPTISLGGKERLILVDGGKRENRLDDNNTFEIIKVNRGSFGTWNFKEIS